MILRYIGTSSTHPHAEKERIKYRFLQTLIDLSRYFCSMMTKAEHINFWKEQAISDFEIARFNAENDKHIAALFFFHLAIEKILKAHWIKDSPLNTTSILS